MEMALIRLAMYKVPTVVVAFAATTFCFIDDILSL